jgi:predicted nuclease with TOPRIM domain
MSNERLREKLVLKKVKITELRATMRARDEDSRRKIADLREQIRNLEAENQRLRDRLNRIPEPQVVSFRLPFC